MCYRLEHTTSVTILYSRDVPINDSDGTNKILSKCMQCYGVPNEFAFSITMFIYYIELNIRN